MHTEWQSQALFCWYGCFCFPPSPLAATTTFPLLVQKNHCRKAQGGLICRWHGPSLHWTSQMPGGGGRTPHHRTHFGRTEEKASELLGWGFNFRGSFGLGYFLNFCVGNYIKYQWGKRKLIPRGNHTVWRTQGFLDPFSVPLCLVVYDRIST